MGRYNFDEIVSRENTNALKYERREAIFGKEDVFPMWVADMEFRTPSFCIDAIKERLEHPILGYFQFPDSFYDSIIWWMKRRHDWDIQKEWISFSPGVVPSISASILAFSNPGDKVIVQSPVYHPFFFSILHQDREVLNNPLKVVDGRYEMDFEDLENKLKTGAKLMLISNPHNPVARAWEPEVLERLGNLCIEYNCILVSDEIHSDLILPGYKHTPTAALSKEISMNTITMMAPSKTFNLAGLATAETIIENPKIKEKFDRVLADALHLNMGNVFGPIALEAAYSKEGEEWLEELMVYLDNNLKAMNDYLKKNHPRIRRYKHESTYLVWLDFSEYGLGHEALKNKLIFEAGLGFNDGNIFGDGGDNKMRVNIALAKSQLMDALKRFEVLERK